MDRTEPTRKPYQSPAVRVYESSEILEMLGPAQGFGSGGGRSGLSADPFSALGDANGGSSQYGRNR